MRKFIDKNNTQKEPAVKKLINLPTSEDTSVIAWNKPKQITPLNSLAITDVSNLIPENVNPTIFSANSGGEKIYFSNELGILQDENGVSLFNGDDISISDVFLLKENTDTKYSISEISSKDFAHSYYISRHYTLAEQNLFRAVDLESFIEESRLPMSIKVVDSNGEEYLDKITRKKKYRILLDPLQVTTLVKGTARPYSIVVLLDHENPKGLYLVYDKVEVVSEKTMSSTTYGHKEYINPVPVFSRISEESVVADKSSILKRIYAQKPIGFSDQITTQSNFSNDGYEVFVPRKALADNRTYETFNWRLIAKINKRIQTSSINYGNEIDSEGNLRQKVVNCAVVCTSADLEFYRRSSDYSTANAYIFNRLASSPFNLAGYNFQNPNAREGLTKTNAEYWLIDIDSITSFDAYDIIAWSPTSSISEQNGQKLRYFIEQKHGTVVLDLSSQTLSSTAANSVYPYLTMSSSSISLSNWEYNIDNIFINESKTNAWPISNNVFESLNGRVIYGIFGSSVAGASGSTKTVKYFNSSSLSSANVVLKETTNNTNNPIFLGIEHRPNANALVRGSLLASCSPIMKYCNDVYQASSLYNQAVSNSGSTQVQETSVQPTAIIEGPFKILYNAVSVALLSKIQASKTTDLRSSTYYLTSNWNSSYVVNSDVLLDEEKSSYSLIPDSNFSDTRKYCKNLTSTYGSIIDYYRRVAYDLLPDQYSILAQDIDLSNIDLYVEVTNNDILLANLSLVNNVDLTGNTNDIPSSHKLYKALPTQYNSNVFAYTNSNSLPFVVPGGFGPHVVKEMPLQYSDQISQSSFSSSLTASSYKSYPFDFEIFTSYSQSSEVPSSFDVTWSAPMTATGTATLSRKKTVQVSSSQSMRDIDVNFSEAYSAVDVDDDQKIRDLERHARITHVRNNFFYSGDIDLGNTTAQHKLGSKGNYVKYIQYTLAYSGIESIKNIQIDGSYGKQTESYVEKFQTEKKLIWVDGVVDSQTKSYLARVWKEISKNTSRYLNIRSKILKADPAVVPFILKAVEAPELNELPGSEQNYKRISFTGSPSGGPQGTIKDIIFVRVPEKFNTKKAENKISQVVINSIKIIPGTFAGASNYKGIKVTKISCAKKADDDKLDGRTIKIVGSASGDKFTKQPIVQNISINGNNGVSGDDAVWFAIQVEGAELGGKFGTQAEGYSIKDIIFDISYTIGDNTTTVESDPVQTFPFTMQFTISGSVTGVNTNQSKKVDFTGRQSTSYTPVPVSVTYPTYYEGNRTETFPTGTTLNFSLTDYKPPFTTVEGDIYSDESVTLNLSTMTYSVGTASITSVRSNNNTVANNLVSLSQDSSSVTFATAAIVYTNLTRKTDPVALSNYFLLKQDGSVVQNSKKSITVLDGLLLLSQPTLSTPLAGKPYGFSLPSAPTPSSPNEEVNIDYGAIVVRNKNAQDNGLIWGFYDNQTKEFLGQVLNYIDYVNRGQNNIYVGVMAIDADGNLSSSIDFIGPSNLNVVTPVRIPMKMAYPVYSVRYKNSTKIKVNTSSLESSKYEQWPLYISSGSFVKDFTVSNSYGWVNWLTKYKNRTIRATYSTYLNADIPWSTFFGKPYIDVKKENPKIISSKVMQLLKYPIATIAEPSYTSMGKINVILDVYTRKDDQSSWVKVSKNLIKSIDSHTGYVEFTSGILPKESKNVYVDYCVKSNGIPVKHVGGTPIPLNPFLHRDIIEFDKILYIYLKPIKLEYRNGSAFSAVEEYYNNEPINFTYDNSIFNQYDSVKYDPFALPIATISVVNHFDAKEIAIEDLRIRGGGVKSTEMSSGNYSDISVSTLLSTVPQALSFWDVYPPLQQAYQKGGFVIIKLPKEVMNNFENKEEIYSIIERNLTAGVAYRLQDMEGNDWGVNL